MKKLVGRTVAILAFTLFLSGAFGADPKANCEIVVHNDTNAKAYSFGEYLNPQQTKTKEILCSQIPPNIKVENNRVELKLSDTKANKSKLGWSECDCPPDAPICTSCWGDLGCFHCTQHE